MTAPDPWADLPQPSWPLTLDMRTTQTVTHRELRDRAEHLAEMPPLPWLEGQR
jgi:hypothetical protein